MEEASVLRVFFEREHLRVGCDRAPGDVRVFLPPSDLGDYLTERHNVGKDFVPLVYDYFSDFLARHAPLKVLDPRPGIENVPIHGRLARLLSRTSRPLSGSRTNPSSPCGPLSRRARPPEFPLAH